MPRCLPVLTCLSLFILTTACASDDGNLELGNDGTAGDTSATDSTGSADSSDTTDGTSDTGAEPTGEELFNSLCSVCHGPEGEGSSIAYEIQHPHDEFTRWVVRNGRASVEFANQAMPAFPTELLTDAELDLIIQYLDGIAQPTTDEDLYLDYCRNCHGADAGGGVVGKELMNSPIQDFIENTRQGRGGSNYGARNLFMPARTAAELSDAEIQAIFDYVQSL